MIWRYFAWTNQTLATIVLWAITWYLFLENKPYIIAFLPAVFMTMVCATFIVISPEGFRLPALLSYSIGGVVTIFFIVLFFVRKKQHTHKKEQNQA